MYMGMHLLNQQLKDPTQLTAGTARKSIPTQIAALPLRISDISPMVTVPGQGKDYT